MNVVAPALALPQLGQLRDNSWLNDELAYLWEHRFSDAPRANRVEVRFARCWKSRLGVISLDPDRQVTNIGINGLLCLPEVPGVIPQITIAHELIHYAHGFGSPLPRRYTHPHRGGIIEREIRARGLGREFDVYQKWIHDHWFDFYERVALNPALRPLGKTQRRGPHETFESQ